MSGSFKSAEAEEFRKAEDLIVKVTFANDISPEGILRARQARTIICDLILLARKRGRPSKQEEILDEAA